jgi:DtxR family transcriptional regulator, Mn-dependent transcriptional regulator
MQENLSASEQEYLKAILLVQQRTGRVSIQALAGRMEIKAASVSAMIRHLAQDEDGQGSFVTHTPYQGVALTRRGEKVAMELLRHQRLLELFLAITLDMPWEQVHDEAEHLAPFISEDLEERIAARLGHPTRDQHGDPIPSREGLVDLADDIPLSTLEVGMQAMVVRVPDEEPALLRYLGTLGLIPGAWITIEARTPYGDILTVRIGEATHPLAGEIAGRISISAMSRQSASPGQVASKNK